MFHFITQSSAFFFNIELNCIKGHQIMPKFNIAAYKNGSHIFKW